MGCCKRWNVPDSNEKRSTNRILSRNEINRFFVDLHEVSVADFDRVKATHKPVIRAFIMMVILILVGGVLLLMNQEKGNEDLMVRIGAGLIFLGTFQYFFLVIVNSCKERGIVKRLRKKIKTFLEGKQQYFKERGLRWEIPSGFPYWIELWLDYKTNPPRAVSRAPKDKYAVGDSGIVKRKIQQKEGYEKTVKEESNRMLMPSKRLSISSMSEQSKEPPQSPATLPLNKI